MRIRPWATLAKFLYLRCEKKVSSRIPSHEEWDKTFFWIWPCLMFSIWIQAQRFKKQATDKQSEVIVQP
jgi:hypothetical protein